MEVFMNFINAMFGSILSLDPVSVVKMVVMWAIGGTLIYLAIKKDMEPSLLLPMGFGAILVNLPLSGAIDQMLASAGKAYDEEAQSIAKQLTSLLEPLMILVLGSVVGFMVVALYMPMFSMFDAINGQA